MPEMRSTPSRDALAGMGHTYIGPPAIGRHGASKRLQSVNLCVNSVGDVQLWVGEQVVAAILWDDDHDADPTLVIQNADEEAVETFELRRLGYVVDQ